MSTRTNLSDIEILYKSLGLPYHPPILIAANDNNDKDIKIVRLDEASYSSSRRKKLNKEEIQASFFQQYDDDDDADADAEKCKALMASFFVDSKSSSQKMESYCGNCILDTEEEEEKEIEVEEEFDEKEVAEHLDYEIEDEEEEEEEDEDEEEVDEDEEETKAEMEEKTTTVYERRKKSNDAELKRFAFGDNRISVCNCNPTECRFGGNCVGSTTIEDMKGMVESFWGTLECAAPATSTRRLLILSILGRSYNINEGQFHFYAGCKKTNNRQICEAAFLNLLGLMNSPNASKAPSQWISAKKHVSSLDYFNKVPYSLNKREKSKTPGENRVKFNHAVAFIEYFARTFGDTIPDENGNCLCSFT
jgi:hypothetical protein